MAGVIYDCECYPNFFSCCATQDNGILWWYFEISEWRDDRKDFFNWLLWLKSYDMVMTGFNNIAYDYALIHRFLITGCKMTSAEIYAFSNQLILAQTEDRFANIIYPSDRYVRQQDLRLIHHFDNVNRMTSLKALEFNMRLDSVEDLPFPVGTVLTKEQAEIVRSYNKHDVFATKKFYEASAEKIVFRENMTRKYGSDFANHNDGKIGKDYFIRSLKKAGIECYVYGPLGRQPKQTLRPSIRLKDAVLPWLKFETPAFQNIVDYLRNQTITQTKGAFDNLTVNAYDMDFVFGTGGIHASVENMVIIADSSNVIVDIDVEAYYPSTAIAQRFKPVHYPEIFSDIYADLKRQRQQFKKGSPENAMLKLAINSVFGDSNNKFSVFYDPLMTMSITINGQLFLCLLIEKLMVLSGISLLAVNTDGCTFLLQKNSLDDFRSIVGEWEKLTKLKMEEAFYSRMFIRDVNSYIAEYVDGRVKKKGAYATEKEWHQDASALVVPKVAEKVLLEGVPIRETVENWPDKMDFMCRIKIPRSSFLTGDDKPLPNLLRHYVAKGGVKLKKTMPPLAKKPGVWRHFDVVSGWRVCPCNHIKDATLPIDFDYYVQEVEKLVLHF